MENMAYFKPSDSESKYYLFGQGGGEQLATETNLPLLVQIPMTEKGKEEENSQIYLELAGKIAQKLVINSVVA